MACEPTEVQIIVTCKSCHMVVPMIDKKPSCVIGTIGNCPKCGAQGAHARKAKLPPAYRTNAK